MRGTLYQSKRRTVTDWTRVVRVVVMKKGPSQDVFEI